MLQRAVSRPHRGARGRSGKGMTEDVQRRQYRDGRPGEQPEILSVHDKKRRRGESPGDTPRLPGVLPRVPSCDFISQTLRPRLSTDERKAYIKNPFGDRAARYEGNAENDV
jgi:hypothetical protein